MSALIPVTRGQEVAAWAFVDPELAPVLRLTKWSLNSSGYAMGSRGSLMHRVVLGLRPGDKLEVDHINRNKMDNRRENLRFATRTENVRNSARYVASQEQRVEIARRWDEGQSRDDIVRALGCAKGSVTSVLKGLRREDEPHPNLVWTREKVAEAVRGFHAEHGRLPLNSEMNGKNGLPWFPVVYRRFPGGVAELREYAGFEPIRYLNVNGSQRLLGSASPSTVKRRGSRDTARADVEPSSPPRRG